MIGDRVVVGDGYTWSEDDKQKTMAYAPQLNERRQHMHTPDGGMIVEAAGGVVCGSTGTIQGEIVNVHRSYLHTHEQRTAAMGTDFVQLVPVFLDKYQKLGYFPVDHIRIFGGSSQ